MTNNKKVLLLSSGLLLVLSFVSLLGFLKPFSSTASVVWEIIFVIASAVFIFGSSPKKMFRLSLFYAFNLIALIGVNFYNSSGVSFAFFVISLIIMSLGFVIAVNNVRGVRIPLPKKSIKELREEVDEAFDNITASNIELEKYYEHNPNAAVGSEKKSVSSSKKRVSKKKAAKKTAVKNKLSRKKAGKR